MEGFITGGGPISKRVIWMQMETKPLMLHEADEMHDRHRAAFNMEAFGFNESIPVQGSPTRAKSSKMETKGEYDCIIDIIQKWGGCSPTPEESIFLKAVGTTGYTYVKQFQLIESSSTIVPPKLGREGNEDGAVLEVVYMLNAFDAIDECHVVGSHWGTLTTFHAIQGHFHNITRSLIDLFIKLCPICNGSAQGICDVDGAKNPIISYDFHHHFQVDFIDF